MSHLYNPNKVYYLGLENNKQVDIQVTKTWKEVYHSVVASRYENGNQDSLIGRITVCLPNHKPLWIVLNVDVGWDDYYFKMVQKL